MGDVRARAAPGPGAVSPRQAHEGGTTVRPGPDQYQPVEFEWDQAAQGVP